MPPRATIDQGKEKLRWRGDQPPDPLEPGVWELYLEGVSTRVTTVACQPGALTVTIRSGASLEDCELALGIVRRSATLGDGTIDSGDAGELSLDQLDQRFGADWQRGQLESAARISIHLARERGPIAMPGPTRSVRVGSGQGSGKVTVCTKCPNMPVAGIWLPDWTNAVAWSRAAT